eukprot:scaffold85857_cov51-Phaeocystis_antarctica.AAC.3
MHGGREEHSGGPTDDHEADVEAAADGLLKRLDGLARTVVGSGDNVAGPGPSGMQWRSFAELADDQLAVP